MIRRLPGCTRIDTSFPCSTLFRCVVVWGGCVGLWGGRGGGRARGGSSGGGGGDAEGGGGLGFVVAVSCRACWMAARSICSMCEGGALLALRTGQYCFRDGGPQAASSILAGLPSFAANVTSMSRLNLDRKSVV